MRPVIGLMPLFDEERESYWMLPGYMTMLEGCGCLPVMLPLTADPEELEALFALCDGLLFTGGHDVDPAVYGAARTGACGRPCAVRDTMEKRLILRGLQADKPMLGICRGIQLFNAVLGGTLYQDLPRERPSPVAHQMAPPYNRIAHVVRILPGTPLSDMLGAGELGVNSYHHQAIRALAPALKPMAVAPDGIVEGVYVPGKRFAMAVQWHPEFFYPDAPDIQILVEEFARACAR